ncbi:hypothetical protein ABIB90_007847 [Bradyrhizobium sp. JR4.1]|uniref:hypothetical protein n=1 Tax=Bradyrhizobium sp. JR4.1 TaxID=3156372 RepID=UPI00339AF3E6
MSSGVAAVVQPQIAVIYLARFAEGVAPVRNFIDSYRHHSIGADHDLVIVWKGFPNDDPSGSPQEAICSQVEHRSIKMTDEGFDITAYKLAAETLPHEYVCFLNTFSEIESDGWLGKLHIHASRDDVGIVGATGSLESVRESMKGMSKAVWLCSQGIPYDPLIAAQWGHEIAKHAPNWLAQQPPSLYTRARRFAKRFLTQKLVAPKSSRRKEIEDGFEVVWAEYGAKYAGFPSFPNPHIRSNAFMLRRPLFLDALPPTLVTKEDCFEFESGHTSMTNSIVRRGLYAVVVGADGKAYRSSEWSGSKTFRSGGQENILVSDNQTRGFEAMSLARRKLYEQWTWHGVENPRNLVL